MRSNFLDPGEELFWVLRVHELEPTRRVAIGVEGFRVKDVPDSKVVEVAEEQTSVLRPELVGPNVIKSPTTPRLYRVRQK